MLYRDIQSIKTFIQSLINMIYKNTKIYSYFYMLDIIVCTNLEYSKTLYSLFK